MRKRPLAILFDLDDTIIDDESRGQPAACWQATLEAHARYLGGIAPAAAFVAIERTRADFWSDPVRSAEATLNLRAASTLVVTRALADLGVALSEERAIAIADEYRAMRTAGLTLFDGAAETLVRLRSQGLRLGLVTNGAGTAQRAKIERFDLARHFDHVQISGEIGHGKPDPRAYEHALLGVGATPAEVWFVGDNLEWDVAAPQRSGLAGIWVDSAGAGLPPGSAVAPDRVIRHIRELLAVIE